MSALALNEELTSTNEFLSAFVDALYTKIGKQTKKVIMEAVLMARRCSTYL